MSAYSSAVLAANPSLYWKLDEPANATTVTDYGPNNLSGTAGSALTFGSTALIVHDPTTSVLFPGGQSVATGNTLSSARSSAIEPSVAFTAEFIVNFSALNFATELLTVGYNPANGAIGFSIQFSSGKILALINNSGRALATTGVTFTSNATAHVALTYDGSNVRLYVNGGVAGSAALAEAVNGYDHLHGLVVGGLPTQGQPYANYSHVALYSTALAQNVIIQHSKLAQGVVFGSFTAAANVAGPGSGSFAVAAAVSITSTVSFNASAATQSTGTSSFNAAATLAKTTTGTFTSSARTINHGSFDAAAYVIVNAGASFNFGGTVIITQMVKAMLASSPVLLWPLSEGFSAPQVADFTHNGLTGIVGSTVTLGSTPILVNDTSTSAIGPGGPNNTSNNIVSAVSSSTQPTSALTLEFTTKISQLPTTMLILMSAGYNPNQTQSTIGMGYALALSPTGRLSAYVGSASGLTGPNVTSSAALYVNKLYHIGFTYDGSVARFYINGILDSATTLSIGAITGYDGVHGFVLGDNSTTRSDSYKGNTLDVGVYNSVLSNVTLKQHAFIATGTIYNAFGAGASLAQTYGNLTASAYVVFAQSGTFAANAFVSKLTATSFAFAADIIARTGQGINSSGRISVASGSSFTSSAAAIAGVSSSFSSSSRVQAALNDSFTPAASVSQSLSGSYTAQAHVQQTSTPIFTSAALVIASGNGSFTSGAYVANAAHPFILFGAVISSTKITSTEFAAQVKAAAIASFSSNAAVVAGVVEHINASAHIRGSGQSTFTPSASIVAEASQPFTATSHVQASVSSSIAAHAYIIIPAAVPISANAVVATSIANPFTASADIYAAAEPQMFTANAIVGFNVSHTVTAAAFIVATVYKPFTAHANVQAVPPPNAFDLTARVAVTTQKTFLASANVQQSVNSTLNAAAVVQQQLNYNVSASAHVAQTLIGQVAAAADVAAITVVPFAANAHIQRSVTAPIACAAHIQADQIGFFNVAADIQQPVIGEIYTNANVAAPLAGSLSANAHVQASRTGVVATSAYINATVSKNFGANANVSVIGTPNSFHVTAAIQQAQSGMLTCAAYVVVPTIATLNAAAHVSLTISSPFSVSANLQKNEIQPIAVSAVVAQYTQDVLNLAATIQQPLQSTISANAGISQRIASSFLTNGAISKAWGGQFSASAKVAISLSGSFAVSASILTTKVSGSFSVNARTVVSAQIAAVIRYQTTDGAQKALTYSSLAAAQSDAAAMNAASIAGTAIIIANEHIDGTMPFIAQPSYKNAAS